jgi:hypothetical protein
LAGDELDFRAAQREDEGVPGATASFPYDRLTVERFRDAFPRARWRDDLQAWFVPGTTATKRLTTWIGREWSGVLRYADERGRDAFEFDPITSPYLEVSDDLAVRTPYSRTVIAALREVPWARWDPAEKAWRVPFRSFEDLRRRWTVIEDAARRAEPEERRKRAELRKAAPAQADRRAEAAERRRHRYPVPENALPPLDRVVMTHAGPVTFEAVTGELADADVVARFYPGVAAGPAALIWASWRRPSHAELVQAWPARTAPGPDDLARGWWQPTIETLREERRRTAALERALATRQAAAMRGRDPAEEGLEADAEKNRRGAHDPARQATVEAGSSRGGPESA